MTEKAIEARGSDVEAAIRSGLSKLGLQRDEVVIEVLDGGSKGLLGIGARDAVVRLKATVIAEPVVVPVEQPAPPPVPAPTMAKTVEVKVEKVEPVTAVSIPQFDEDLELEAEQETERNSAVEVIATLLEKMRISAEITTSLTEPDDVTGKRINVIEIHGDDLSTLIGPRGETLNALQYITRLMVGHNLQTRANFVIDVEGYRQRREQALARLADRMARKVAKQKRPMSLEPMPPHERRIIHMTLRNDKYVYTESTGEGNRRKVRIIPKRAS
jgi:spoIIIJ-associated protein